MSTFNKLGSYTQYTDNSIIEIPGPDNTTFAYQYDQQTRSFYAREASLIYSGKHGLTHISTDPIPAATCVTPGLLSADDKCRLDNLVGTRLGVLGFQGSGFPDDGGFLSGDIILSTGSEMMSIERVGNVIRFVVDVPAVFTCGNEDCVQMYWLQDETDIAAIRPPIAGGKLLGQNTYGALKIYLFPENTIVNPANPSATLNNKGQYPMFVFIPYDDGTGSNEGQIQAVLQRNGSGVATVGWAFTPGSNGVPQYKVVMGVDSDSNINTFQLSAEYNAGVLGALFYNGSSITRRLAIITSYDSTVLTSNVYNVQWWDPQARQTLGTEFKVVNQPSYDLTTNTAVLDGSSNTLLAVGQVIDVFSVQVGTSNNQPTYVHYCQEQPSLSANSLWTTIGSIQFGDQLVAKDGATTSATVSDSRTYDNDWGIDGLKDVTLFNSGTPLVLHTSYEAQIDTATPCLTVFENPGTNSELRRPVTIWHRTAMRNAYLEIHLARPVAGGSDGTNTIVYPPIDVLVRAPVDSFTVQVAKIASVGTLSTTANYTALSGVRSDQIPSHGLVRVLAPSGHYNNIFAYTAVLRNDDGSAVLVMTAAAPSVNDFVEVLHEDYETPAARLQFQFNNGHDLKMQAQVGVLNPSANYPGVAGLPVSPSAYSAGAFLSGYAVGTTCYQDGAVTSGTTGYTSSPSGFVTYTGAGDNMNVLQVLVLESQLWMWWNGLLLAPSPSESAVLGTPVDISTPYYPLTDVVKYGKFGLRLFPGAKVRRMIVRSQPTQFSQYSLGQLEVS